MRERKGVQQDNRKGQGREAFPAANRVGWVAGQPREARLRTCPTACYTQLDGVLDIERYSSEVDIVWQTLVRVADTYETACRVKHLASIHNEHLSRQRVLSARRDRLIASVWIDDVSLFYMKDRRRVLSPVNELANLYLDLSVNAWK
jgi:hypothetical protein